MTRRENQSLPVAVRRMAMAENNQMSDIPRVKICDDAVWDTLMWPWKSHIHQAFDSRVTWRRWQCWVCITSAVWPGLQHWSFRSTSTFFYSRHAATLHCLCWICVYLKSRCIKCLLIFICYKMNNEKKVNVRLPVPVWLFIHSFFVVCHRLPVH